MDIIEDSSILYLLIFIWAVEQDEEITTFVKENTDNFEGYNISEDDLNDLSEIVIRDPIILNRTFSYWLNKRNIEMLKYVIDGSKNMFLMPWVTENQIIELILNLKDPRVEDALKYLWTIDVTLINNPSTSSYDVHHENTNDNIDIPLIKNPSSLLKKVNILPPINLK